MLLTPESCKSFIAQSDAATIATQLRRDQELCRAGKLPSLLSLYLPISSTELAQSISLELLRAVDPNANAPSAVLGLQYEGILENIKAHLNRPIDNEENDPIQPGRRTKPSSEEFLKSLRVMEYLLANTEETRVNETTPLKDIMIVLQNQSLNLPHSETKTTSKGTKPQRRGRRCYICRKINDRPHKLYPSMCNPCGHFNISESSFSLPENLDLLGKTALVTGGRVGLGYSTALRLLRCGAHVIVTSRYPRDAETRYLSESDSESWTERLQVIGADFRTAKDVFRLVNMTKEILFLWSKDLGEVRLDILINNAAQTLTDPIRQEQKAIEYEATLKSSSYGDKTLLYKNDNGYEPRVRGGAILNFPSAISSNVSRMSISDATKPTNQDANLIVQNHAQPKSHSSVMISPQIQEASKISWTQTLTDIPYEDIISAHAVNTFTPLVLTRELLPYMGGASESSRDSSTSQHKPHGYIVHVSSREGIPLPLAPGKDQFLSSGTHVHTNMSKAALNMLTFTEAGVAWKEKKVAINTVDPGFMSGVSGAEPPLKWEDGAGRVLWPIAMGEKGETVWGRTLKHYGEGEI